MRRSLGKSELVEQSPADQLTLFDSALEELIAAAQTPAQTKSQPESDSMAPKLAEAQAEQELLNQLLEAAQNELDQSAAELKELGYELEAIQLEATESAEAADRAERRGRWLSKRLSLPGADPSTEDDYPLRPRQLLKFCFGSSALGVGDGWPDGWDGGRAGSAWQLAAVRDQVVVRTHRTERLRASTEQVGSTTPSMPGARSLLRERRPSRPLL